MKTMHFVAKLPQETRELIQRQLDDYRETQTQQVMDRLMSACRDQVNSLAEVHLRYETRVAERLRPSDISHLVLMGRLRRAVQKKQPSTILEFFGLARQAIRWESAN